MSVYMCDCVCEKLIAAHCGSETGMFRACCAFLMWLHYYDSVQDCSISSALAKQILQSCTKPSICSYEHMIYLLTYSLVLFHWH